MFARSRIQPYIPQLIGANIVKASNCIKKLSNVNGDNVAELVSHLPWAAMKLMAMDLDPKAKQAILILMSSFSGKLGHWAEKNTKVLYNLKYVSRLVAFVRSKFVVKDSQAECYCHRNTVRNSRSYGVKT